MKKLLKIFLLLAVCSACKQGYDPNISGEAMWLYEKAKKGDSEAMNVLGNCYAHGEGGAHLNYEKAVYWYKEAAKKGNAAARCNLGYYFEIGRAVKQNCKKAAELYRKAAEQGYAEAQYRLGYCYDCTKYEKDHEKNIFGLEHDRKQAFWWYQEAAKNGYDEAQYKLGEIYSSSCYSNTYGVSENTEEAKDWFRKAAKQGSKKAEDRLKAYTEGTSSATTKSTIQKFVNKEYVDLGLPSGTLWATMNVGANRPEDYGDYFAWGETKPKNNYNLSTYKWCNDGYETLNKYCDDRNYGSVDYKTELDLSDDAATTNWGQGWRMPTDVQQNELRIECNWTWTIQNGVSGYLVKSKLNGASLFLPVAGSRFGYDFILVGEFGSYWSRTLYNDSPLHAVCLDFKVDFLDWDHEDRSEGKSVRAVRVK